MSLVVAAATGPTCPEPETNFLARIHNIQTKLAREDKEADVLDVEIGLIEEACQRLSLDPTRVRQVALLRRDLQMKREKLARLRSHSGRARIAKRLNPLLVAFQNRRGTVGCDAAANASVDTVLMPPPPQTTDIVPSDTDVVDDDDDDGGATHDPEQDDSAYDDDSERIIDLASLGALSIRSTRGIEPPVATTAVVTTRPGGEEKQRMRRIIVQNRPAAATTLEWVSGFSMAQAHPAVASATTTTTTTMTTASLYAAAPIRVSPDPDPVVFHEPFLRLFQRYFAPQEVVPKFVQSDRCHACKFELRKIKSESQLVCPNPRCGISVPYMDSTSEALAYGEEIEIPEHVYERFKHFRTWLGQFREGTPVVPDYVIVLVDQQFRNVHDKSRQKVRPTPVRDALRRLSLTQYSQVSMLITHRLNNLPIAELNIAEFDRILLRFQMIQVPFLLLKEDSRKNFPNFNFSVNKSVQADRLFHFTGCFPLLKTRRVLQRLDKVMQKIYALLDSQRTNPFDLEWIFYRSV